MRQYERDAMNKLSENIKIISDEKYADERKGNPFLTLLGHLKGNFLLPDRTHPDPLRVTLYRAPIQSRYGFEVGRKTSIDRRKIFEEEKTSFEVHVSVTTANHADDSNESSRRR